MMIYCACRTMCKVFWKIEFFCRFKCSMHGSQSRFNLRLQNLFESSIESELGCSSLVVHFFVRISRTYALM
uniref:Uncharacterized protein n=1 Tax=Rhizophora mucronata TaxID=61149 RepID=A0A2P2PVN7_RHIMU